MNTKIDPRIGAIVNVMAFVAMLVVNILATSLPLNNMTTGELSDAIPNLFVPIGLTFSIWGVIWTLLAVYLVRQLVTAFRAPAGATPAGPWAASTVCPWFALNMLLNAAWIFAWHYQAVGISVLIMFGLLATLIVMFLNLDRAVRADSGSWFARVPISVYFGWITIATIANITAFLVTIDWNGFGVAPVVWTVVVIVAGLAITVAMLIRHRNVAFAAIAVWAFAGIAAKRSAEGLPEGPAVLAVAIAAASVIAIVAAAILLGRRRRSGRHDD